MKQGVKFKFSEFQVSNMLLKKNAKKLETKVKKLNSILDKGYDDENSSINLVSDKQIIKESKKIVDKVRDADILVVIGIGGSNLGTLAIYEALKGKLYNELCDKKVYFVDTVDSNSINNIVRILRKEMKNGKKICLNAISKSGGTTETIANFDILLALVAKYSKYNYKDYIVITTGVNSKFETFAKDNNYNVLNLPDKVGGRFSVFSNVGVFPLLFLGVDVKQLFIGASEMRNLCLSNDFENNPALMSAIYIHHHNLEGKNIFNTFLFSGQLESVGKWYRQLLGESIGKEFDLNEEKINLGITPITSIGSTDLHSMAQLFLGGPSDKFHCFIDVLDVPSINIVQNAGLEKIVPSIAKKNFNDIMGAILKGIQSAFITRKIPFYEINLSTIDEYNIGALLQMKMIEMMFLGELFNVNTFNQPNVEEYKVMTKRFLENV